ncbi:sulfate adenylyltransferase subunit CysD [Holophaga foetida]|uniref:sulfate adenylyltransferase subunit CysD n=1 Tax=Holophaga foetida TaxID=35839 RepID=UPI0002473AD4|nr:sulfate adenylyltransferase subunit CysD [Holophaga foetida]
MTRFQMTCLQQLEAEAIHILREVAATARNPVMLYSVGKDSSVILHLAKKAFHPGPVPFPLMHVDTGYKFPEMYAFREEVAKDPLLRVIVEGNEPWIAQGCHPVSHGVDRCCSLLKTAALLEALEKHGFDVAIGGARREEEKSRAKERIFSLRDRHGQWDPKNQRPELWDLYNTGIKEGESLRVFPLSNWTELDVWQYIRQESIPVVPIYFAQVRKVVRRGNILIPVGLGVVAEGEVEELRCRFRSLGCMPCTGAVASDATTLDGILEEVAVARKSERENRVIDLTGDASMEQKKREGYF